MLYRRKKPKGERQKPPEPPSAAPPEAGRRVVRGAASGETVMLGRDPLPVHRDNADSMDNPEVFSPLNNDYARYCDFEHLGTGGIAVVQSCLDPNLRRKVAIKMLHPHLAADKGQRARFLREARVMAQIAHPSIVPVHEVGRSADGTLYFTMKRVRGVSLLRVVEELKRRNREFEAGYPLPRLIDVFRQICQAVAFAHSRGFIHRDLKPENVLIGDFGEVQVTDWGLVKAVGAHDAADAAGPESHPNGHAQNEHATIDGHVAGTPRYMSPEQALGQIASLDERSDVYGLGAILYEILTLQFCVAGDTVDTILRNVVAVTPRSPRRRAPYRKVPPELDAICMKCLAKPKAERYANVRELIRDLDSFHQGLPVSAHRDTPVRQAWKWFLRHLLVSVSSAVAAVAFIVGVSSLLVARSVRYEMLTRTADRFSAEGGLHFAEKVKVFRELEKAKAQWLLQEPNPREVELQEDLARLHLMSENRYRTAVMLYVQAGNAMTERQRRAYTEIFTNQIDYALMTQDYNEFKRILNFIQYWLGENFEHATPGDREWLLRVAARARGDGAVRVNSDPPGAEVTLWEVGPGAGRAWVPARPQYLGTTPVGRIALSKGDYLLTFELAGHPPVQYPLVIDHGENEVVDVFMPRRVPAGTVYVPAGEFYTGGTHSDYRLHQVQIEGFYMKTAEVTFGDYLEYWRSQVASAPDPDAMCRVCLAPEDRVLRDAWDGAGVLIPGLRREWPVVGVTRTSARRYCEWLGKRLGRTCRLPTAQEWEKAARGADGREFVWGNEYDPTFAFALENSAAKAAYGLFAPPGSVATDCSIYGAFDMAGNAREWTSSLFPGGSPFPVIKGGSGSATRRYLYCSFASDAPLVPTDVGFRYVITVDEQLDAN